MAIWAMFTAACWSANFIRPRRISNANNDRVIRQIVLLGRFLEVRVAVQAVFVEADQLAGALVVDQAGSDG